MGNPVPQAPSSPSVEARPEECGGRQGRGMISWKDLRYHLDDTLRATQVHFYWKH